MAIENIQKKKKERKKMLYKMQTKKMKGGLICGKLLIVNDHSR